MKVTFSIIIVLISIFLFSCDDKPNKESKINNACINHGGVQQTTSGNWTWNAFVTCKDGSFHEVRFK